MVAGESKGGGYMKKILLIGVILSLMVPWMVIGGCRSNTVTMTIVSVDTFAFARQPAGAIAGAKFNTQPVVHVTDENGKLDVKYNGFVTLSIASNLNPTGAELKGTVTVIAVDGVATFTDLSIDAPGNGYALMVTNESMTPILSEAFNVAPAATSSGTTKT
jgi:hypothetical protein